MTLTAPPRRPHFANGVLVALEGVENDDQLSGWIQRALKFVGKLPKK